VPQGHALVMAAARPAGITQTRALASRQVSAQFALALLLPARRQRPLQVAQHQHLISTHSEDRLDDVGRRQSESQDALGLSPAERVACHSQRRHPGDLTAAIWEMVDNSSALHTLVIEGGCDTLRQPMTASASSEQKGVSSDMSDP
jgi:hypothetical protein